MGLIPINDPIDSLRSPRQVWGQILDLQAREAKRLHRRNEQLLILGGDAPGQVLHGNLHGAIKLRFILAHFADEVGRAVLIRVPPHGLDVLIIPRGAGIELSPAEQGAQDIVDPGVRGVAPQDGQQVIGGDVRGGGEVYAGEAFRAGGAREGGEEMMAGVGPALHGREMRARRAVGAARSRPRQAVDVRVGRAARRMDGREAREEGSRSSTGARGRGVGGHRGGGGAFD